MTTPTPERIAAALALAEACEARAKALNYIVRGDAEHHIWNVAFPAYRATARKLRTRAEVDADLVLACRLAIETGQLKQGALFEQRVRQLVAEPTQDSGPSSEETSSPRVAATGAAFPCGRCKGQGYTVSHSTRRRCDVTCGLCNGTGEDPRQPPAEPNPSESSKSSDEEEAEIQAGDHEDDQCGCDESEALKRALSEALRTNDEQTDKLDECRKLLDFARRSLQDIVTILEEGRA